MLDIIIIIAARPLLIDAGEQIMYLKFNQDNKIVLKKKKKYHLSRVHYHFHNIFSIPYLVIFAVYLIILMRLYGRKYPHSQSRA